MEKLVIDATETVLGRIASFAAKQALLGKEVVIINCDKAIVTGRKEAILQEYRIKKIRGKGHLKGPYFHNVPEKIVRRAVRGMLPYKRTRGSIAYKNVVCHNGASNYSQSITLKKPIKSRYITLSQLCKLL